MTIRELVENPQVLEDRRQPLPTLLRSNIRYGMLIRTELELWT